MHIPSAYLEGSARTWQQAGDTLDFRVTAPFVLKAHGTTAKYIAFLPDFGSARGMVIAPTIAPGFDLDPLLVKLAEENGWFYSFVNAMAWTKYDEKAIRDALTDWGFFGLEEKRPAWFQRRDE